MGRVGACREAKRSEVSAKRKRPSRMVEALTKQVRGLIRKASPASTMGISESGADQAKFDELLKEIRSGNRVQFLMSLLALVPGVVAAVAKLGNAIVVLAFVLPVVVVIYYLFAYPSSSRSIGNWRNLTIARERLRLLDRYYKKHLGVAGYHDAYLMILRSHYQFALTEGRKDLAEYLKQELDKETSN